MASALETRRVRIAKEATEQFRGHVLQHESDITWYSGAPGVSVHSYRVVCPRWAIVVYGDHQLILRPGEAQVLVWLRDAFHRKLGPDHVLQRVLDPWPIKVFVPEAADEIFASRTRLGRLFKRYMRERNLRPEVAWKKVWSQEEAPNVYDWSDGMLWCYHALERFVELLEGSRTANLG